MPSIVTNFKFRSNSPNFERDQVRKIKDLRLAEMCDYDIGHIVYCIENNKHYAFGIDRNSINGTIKRNTETGYFAELRTGVGEGSGGSNDDAGVRMQIAYKRAAIDHTATEVQIAGLGLPTDWYWDTENDIVSHIDGNDIDREGWAIDDSKLERNDENGNPLQLWQSVGVFYLSDPGVGHWGTPYCLSARPGEDGDTIEFIYARTIDETTIPVLPSGYDKNDKEYQSPDFFPTYDDDEVPKGMVYGADSEGNPRYWFDNPQGISQEIQCEWFCQRFRKDGKWEPFSDPTLWAKWGVVGRDGDGVEYIFNKRTVNDAPPLPAFCSDEDFDVTAQVQVWQKQDDKYIPVNYQADEYIPNGKFKYTFSNGDTVDETIGGWLDEPAGVSIDEPWEFVSIRKFNRKTDTWGKFSKPVLWAHYSRQGFRSYVFTKSMFKPATPIDNVKEFKVEDNNGKTITIGQTIPSHPIPVDPNLAPADPDSTGNQKWDPETHVVWYDGIPDNDNPFDDKGASNGKVTAPLYMSWKDFYIGEKGEESTGWSEPAIMKDSNDMLVEYNNSDTLPEDPIGNYDKDGIDSNGWYDPYDLNSIGGNDWTDDERRDYVDDAIWMAMLKLNNGEPVGEWTIVKIKGEDGEDGTSINIRGTYDTYEALENARINTISVNDTMIEPEVSGGFKSYDETNYKDYPDDNIKQYNPNMGDTYLVKNVNVMAKDGTWREIATTGIYYENSQGHASYNPATVLPERIDDFNAGVGELEHIALFTNGAFTWDGDSWVFVGQIAGNSNYVHIKYSDNPGVLDKGATEDKKAEINNSLKDVPTDDNVICKYMGICVHGDINPPVNVTDEGGNVTKYEYEFYKWSKFAGEDGFGYEYIYMRSYGNNPENPVLPILSDDKKPEGYDDSYQKPEYVPGTEEERGIYNKPELDYLVVDDGKGKPGKKYTWWTDDQQGVSEEYPYEWMTWRKYSKENGKWGEWKGNSDGKAFLQNVWNGMEFTSFVFTRLKYDVDLTKAKVTGGTFSNPIPTMTTYETEDGKTVVYHTGDNVAWQWHDSVPTNSTGNIWMTQARFNIGMDGTGTSTPTWSPPVIMNDTTEQDVDWCPYDMTDPGTPDNPDTAQYWFENVYTDTDADGDAEQKWPVNEETKEKHPAIWMAVRPLKNGTAAGPWVITRIHGEKGDKGDPGTSINIKGRYTTWEEFMAAWLGPDGEYPGGYPFDGEYNGTLTGGEPKESHAYLIETKDGQPWGHVYTYVPSAYDGEDMVTVWVDCGKFTGEDGLPSYTHIKYSDNPDVMNSDIDDDSDLIGVINDSMSETPIGTDDKGNAIIRKYMGIYSDNKKEDEDDYRFYKWSKFVGEDGLGYEYIYKLTGDNTVPELPLFCSGEVLPEGTTVKIELDNGSLADINYQENDFIPNGKFVYTDAEGTTTTEEISGWTDGQSGVSDNANSQFEWMSCRIKKTWGNGRYEWGPFSTPVISSHWGTQQYSTIKSLHLTPSVVKVKNGQTDSIKVEIMTVTGDEKEIQNVPVNYTVKAKLNNSEEIFSEKVETEGSLQIKIPENKLSDNPNTLQIELYDPSDGNDGGDLIDSETLPILYDGDSNLQINLTNDSYYLKCNAYGDPIDNSEEATTEVELYYGLDKLGIGVKNNDGKYPLTIGDTEVGECEINITKDSSFTGPGYVTQSGNSFTFSGFDADHPISLTFSITVNATINGKSLSKSINFVVNKIQPGGDAPSVYTLIPSTKSIINDNGTNTPASVCISKVYKQVYGDGGQIKLEEVTNLSSEGLALKYCKDGGAVFYRTAISKHESGMTSSIEFRLVEENTFITSSDDVTVADIYIPVVKNGKNGLPAEFKRMTSSTSVIKRFKDAEGNYAYTPTAFTLYAQTITGNSINDSWDKDGIANVVIKDKDGESLFDKQIKVSTTTTTVDLENLAKQDDENLTNLLNDAHYINIIVKAVGTNNGYYITDTLTIPILSDGESGEVTDIYSLQCSTDVIKVDKDGDYTPENMTPLAILRKGSDFDVLQTILPDKTLPNGQEEIDNPGYQIWIILKRAANEYYALSNYLGSAGSGKYYVALKNKIDNNTYLKYNINKLVNNLELEENSADFTKRDVPGFFGRDTSGVPFGINMPSNGEYAIATGINSAQTPIIGSPLKTVKIQDSQSLEVYLIYEPSKAVLDHESIPILKDGEDTYTVNLSNDLIAISCDAEGKPHLTGTYTSTVSVYKGISDETTAVTNSNGINLGSYSAQGWTATLEGNDVKINVPNKTNIINSGEVPVIVTVDGIEITKTLKVIAVKDGQQGTSKSGKIPYYAGVYSSTAKYLQTATATPYVFYNNSAAPGYYLFIHDNYGSAAISNQAPTNTTYWLKMEHFEAMYANIGIMEKALVGGAVFNENWIFSQDGCKYEYQEASMGGLGAHKMNNATNTIRDHNTFRDAITHTGTKNNKYWYNSNKKPIIYNSEGYSIYHEYDGQPYTYDSVRNYRPNNMPVGEEVALAVCTVYFCKYEDITDTYYKNIARKNGIYINLFEHDNGKTDNEYLFVPLYNAIGTPLEPTGGTYYINGNDYTVYSFSYDIDLSEGKGFKCRKFVNGPIVSGTVSEDILYIRKIVDKCDTIVYIDENGEEQKRYIYGTLIDNECPRLDYGAYIMKVTRAVSNEYENFNPAVTNIKRSLKFVPNWAVNLQNGSMWTGGGSNYMIYNGAGGLANGKISWDVDGNLYLPPTGTLSMTTSPDKTLLKFTYYIANGTSLTSNAPINVRIEIDTVSGDSRDVVLQQSYSHGVDKSFPFSDKWYVQINNISNNIQSSDYDSVIVTLYVDNMPAQELDITEYIVKTFAYSLTNKTSKSIRIESWGVIHTNDIPSILVNGGKLDPDDIKQLTILGGISGASMYREYHDDNLHSEFDTYTQFNDVIQIVKLSTDGDNLDDLAIILGYNVSSLYDFGNDLAYNDDTNSNNRDRINISGDLYYIGIRAVDPDLGQAKATVGQQE